MSEKVKVLAPKEYEIVFGPVIFEGFMKGTFIEIDYDDELTSDERGVDDEVAVTVLGSSTADVTVTLMQTSQSNLAMSVLANLVMDAPGMAGAIHPLFIRDPNGFTVYESANAWIKARPNAKLADTVQPRAWVIRAPHLKFVEGGN